MWFLATFRMISLFTIPKMFTQIYSYKQQYQTENLVHMFLTVSRHINRLIEFNAGHGEQQRKSLNTKSDI